MTSDAHTHSPQATPWITPKQLAARWHCSLMKLRRLRKAGQLGVAYLGGSARYDFADVLRIEDESRLRLPPPR